MLQIYVTFYNIFVSHLLLIICTILGSPYGPGYAPLRCASALRVASRWSTWLLSLLHPPDSIVAQRDSFPRSGPPHAAPSADAALRSSLLSSFLSPLASGCGRSVRPASATASCHTRPAPFARPALSPLPCRAGPRKGPTPPAHSPEQVRVAGQKRPATRQVKLAFRPRRPKNKARFAEGFVGEHPKPPPSCPGQKGPVIFLGFRSQKMAAPSSQGALRAGSLGASARSPNPLGKAFKWFAR